MFICKQAPTAARQHHGKRKQTMSLIVFMAYASVGSNRASIYRMSTAISVSSSYFYLSRALEEPQKTC